MDYNAAVSNALRLARLAEQAKTSDAQGAAAQLANVYATLALAEATAAISKR